MRQEGGQLLRGGGSPVESQPSVQPVGAVGGTARRVNQGIDAGGLSQGDPKLEGKQRL